MACTYVCNIVETAVPLSFHYTHTLAQTQYACGPNATTIETRNSNC